MQLNEPVSDIRLHRLRSDLQRADFTVTALNTLWGASAAEALHRGQRVPALRNLESTHGFSALSTLARLFVLGLPVNESDLAQSLPALGTAGAVGLGLVEVDVHGQRARTITPLLDLRPYDFVDSVGNGSWWILSDLGEVARGGALRTDHVLGIGGASLTLTGQIIQRPVARALDLGTGCGIQALHVSRHARNVVATDISERAVAMAKMNAELNGIANIEFRVGDLFEPVAGENFDHIVSNPPFVITPRSDDVPEYDYRDGGMIGDRLVEVVIDGLYDHLSPGGIAQLLGNWEYHSGNGEVSSMDGLERVRSWVETENTRELDVWVIERDMQEPTDYSETWIRDGGTVAGSAEFDRLYRAWLDDFDRRGVRAIGFGYVLARKPNGGASDRRPPIRRLEKLHGALGHNGAGLGEHLALCLAGHDWQSARDDAALARTHFVVAGDVTEERHLWPGDDEPTTLLLHQGGGFGRTISVDTALAAFVGACDGELSAGSIVLALAELLSADPEALAPELYRSIRRLIGDAILLPSE